MSSSSARKKAPLWLLAVILPLALFLLAALLIQRASVGPADVTRLQAWFETLIEDGAQGEGGARPFRAESDGWAVRLTYSIPRAGEAEAASSREIEQISDRLSATLCEAAPVRKLAGSHQHAVYLRLIEADSGAAGFSVLAEREITCGY